MVRPRPLLILAHQVGIVSSLSLSLSGTAGTMNAASMWLSCLVQGFVVQQAWQLLGCHRFSCCKLAGGLLAWF